MISIDCLMDAIEEKNGFPLDDNQRAAIEHGTGPLWIIAGPGTGKTEVLVIRCLKLICCDGINPGSIILTTFTEKAARNLEDRILETMLFLCDRYPILTDIDICDLRIGTLHSLCNDIMQEYRYSPYQNLRLLNDLETKMLIRNRIAWQVIRFQTNLYANFEYLFRRGPGSYLWKWTNVLSQLYDRLIDYRINIDALQEGGNHWRELKTAYELYSNTLRDNCMCDFSHLQKYFLEFLQSPRGHVFINGDEIPQNLPLLYVLVDEYQDTNPIQEEIYFTLANNVSHNITVVGDDDQALYRFRGGTVECMVGFSAQCHRRWGINANQITLVNNYRSNTGIVEWCNIYINSFPLMSVNQARVENKPQIRASSGRIGNHPNVGLLKEKTIADLTNSFAHTVLGLHENNIINDYSQCVLLMKSTKDSRNNAGPYIQALQELGIPIYNPRSKAFLDQIEIHQILGAFVSIVDPGLEAINGRDLPGGPGMLEEWVNEYNRIAEEYPALRQYIERSQEAISNMTLGNRISPATPTILYRILAHEPFTSYQLNPEQDLRLSKVTRLFEAFCSQVGRPLYMDNEIRGKVNQWWLGKFYEIFCGYLQDQGIDDDEDDEVVCPQGRFPIMTIHQSKGLEFDFVFVGSLGRSVTLSGTHTLEHDLLPFRSTPPIIHHRAEDAAWHDYIRLHYVAYSRAKHALILLASDNQLRKRGHETASFGGQGGLWVKNNIIRL